MNSRRMLYRRKWNRLIDGYLDFSDEFFVNVTLARSRSHSIATQSSIVQPKSKAMYKYTLLGLIIAFLFVLASCQSMPRTPSQGRSPFYPQGERPPEQIFVKRDTQSIRPAESGSKTGSIWGATSGPRQLFVEPRPDNVGQVVTVNIPDDLQFKFGQDAGGGADKKDGNVDVSSKLTTAASRMTDPMKSFKMTIVAIESTGDVYLRGTRSFKSDGRDKNVTVFAKVPRRALSTFEVDAKQLSEVAVTEESANAGKTEYATPGWDQMVSRKLAGFVPDVAAENRALEDARFELIQFQKALNDRRKSMDDDSERLRKDRDRLAAEEENSKEKNAAAEPATNAKQDKGKGAKPDAKSPPKPPAKAATKPEPKSSAN